MFICMSQITQLIGMSVEIWTSDLVTKIQNILYYTMSSLIDYKIPKGKYGKVRDKGQNDLDDLKIWMPYLWVVRVECSLQRIANTSVH